MYRRLISNRSAKTSPTSLWSQNALSACRIFGAARLRSVSICSGLVQIALTACGVSCPRDTDMQDAALGNQVRANADWSNLERGDFVFWKGHVAIVHDAASLLHANAFHMAVAIEPIAAAIARIRAAGSEITSVRRLGR